MIEHFYWVLFNILALNFCIFLESFLYFHSCIKWFIISKDILKLPCVQNYLASVVTRSPRFSHSVPLLKYLHLLHVQSRIIFKLCTIAYQIKLFLPENLHIYFHAFFSPQVCCLFPELTTRAGTHVFPVAVPTLWNSLSGHVK